jgi:predicted HTH domain antitoxin
MPGAVENLPDFLACVPVAPPGFPLGFTASVHYLLPMTITLPDDPALAEMGEAEIRLDLACGAYAAGHVSRGVAARMAGLDRPAFDRLLMARRIPSYDEERLAEDRETLRALRRL